MPGNYITIAKLEATLFSATNLAGGMSQIAWPFGCEWRPAYLNDHIIVSDPTGEIRLKKSS